MHFKPENVEAFLDIFRASKPKIQAFEGCYGVELYQDPAHDNIRFTLSKWESEDHLNTYRHSELFEGTWAATKALFDGKPLAYTLAEKKY